MNVFVLVIYSVKCTKNETCAKVSHFVLFPNGIYFKTMIHFQLCFLADYFSREKMDSDILEDGLSLVKLIQ